jgi:hypothetical protein
MNAVSSYSANVVLTLIVGGTSYALSHVGPDEIVIRDKCYAMPPCNGKLIIRVDNRRKTKRVFFPHGIAGSNQPAKYW